MGATIITGPPGGGASLVESLLLGDRAAEGVGGGEFRVAIDAWLHGVESDREAPPLDGVPDESSGDPRTLAGDAIEQLTRDRDVLCDPAAAFVLPLLRRRGLDPDVVVVAWRGPEATIAELSGIGISPLHALALWEAHLVAALHNTRDLLVVGVDVDDLANRSSARDELCDDLQAAGWRSAEPGRLPELSEWVLPPAAATSAHDWAEEIASVVERQAPFLKSARGVHPDWEPPDGLVVGRWSAEVLAAHRARKRAALDAAAARAASYEPVTEVVEHRRELWRLRDEVLGLQAERANVTAALYETDAKWRTAQHRADTLAERFAHLELDELRAAREQRDAMAASREWTVGRSIVGPLRKIKRAFARS